MPFDKKVINEAKKITSNLEFDLTKIERIVERLERKSSQAVYDDFKIDQTIDDLLPKLFWAIKNKSTLKNSIRIKLLNILKDKRIRARFELKILRARTRELTAEINALKKLKRETGK